MGSRNSNSVNQKKDGAEKERKPLLYLQLLQLLPECFLVLHIRCLRLIQ